MNKKGQQRDYSGMILLVVISFLLAGVLIYFIGKMVLFIGFGAILLSLILLWIAGSSNNEELVYLGLFLLALGTLLVIGGFAITSFFEGNEVGEIWLNGGKTVMNTTAETYKTVKGVMP